MRNIDIHSHALAHRQPPATLPESHLQSMSTTQLEEYTGSVEAHVARQVLLCDARENLSEALSRTVRINSGKRPGANTIVGITGPNGVGKSTLIRHWVDEAYLRWFGPVPLDPDRLPRWSPEPGMTVSQVPVVWVSPAGATSKTAFQGEIARFLGYHGTRAPAAALGLLSRHGVRVLVIDDCHFLRTQDQWGRAMLDTVKKANNELGEHGGTLVLVGANLEGGDLFGDPQISRRLLAHHLAPFGIDTHAEKVAWQRHLKAWEAQILPYLPRAQPGFLYRQAGLLWRLTQGFVRDVHELLVEATADALVTREWTITPARLGEATVSLQAEEIKGHRERAAARKASSPNRGRAATA